MAPLLRIVMIGDIVGKPGRRAVASLATRLRQTYSADLLIANAENIAGGSGITNALYRKLKTYGIDGVTLGDHAFRQRDGYQAIQQADDLIRPANLPGAAIGKGWMCFAPADNGHGNHRGLCVITVLGRLYMNGPLADDPYATVDRILATLPPGVPVLVEVHAEATSEKVAMGHYLDGRVAAVVGTHTHIPTADAKILPGGTAYMTDLGMTGPYDSVLGRRKERVVGYMTTGMPEPFDVATGDVRLCGAFITIDNSGKAVDIQRVEMAMPDDGGGDEGDE